MPVKTAEVSINTQKGSFSAAFLFLFLGGSRKLTAFFEEEAE